MSLIYDKCQNFHPQTRSTELGIINLNHSYNKLACLSLESFLAILLLKNCNNYSPVEGVWTLANVARCLIQPNLYRVNLRPPAPPGLHLGSGQGLALPTLG